MEVLGGLFSKAVDTGNFCGIATPNAGPVVSHLIYADDVLVLGEWSTNNFKNVIRILRCFYLISGLKMNPSKSKLFGLGDSAVENLKAVADVNKVSMGEFPFSYLGVPIGENINRVKSWDVVIHTVENRLSKWKELSLSIGGRVTLIKSVLNSLPMYFLSLFKAPKQVTTKLDVIRKRFLWGGLDEKRKIHWVSWDRVIAPKSSGGLGLDSIQDTNDSMLVKWLWRFNTEDSKLWRRIIASLHTHDSSSNALPTARFCGIWYNICQVSKVLLKRNFNVSQFMRLIPSGDQSSFQSWVWDAGGNDKTFTVASCKKALQRLDAKEYYKFDWNNWLPKKVNVFGWRAEMNRLPTRDNLIKRRIPVTSDLCPLCNEVQETADHLLISCAFASTIWQKIGDWCRLPPIYAFTIRDLLELHLSSGLQPVASSMLQAAILVTCWSIWRARNELVFEGVSPSIQKVFERVQSLGFLWIKNRAKTVPISWVNWRNFSFM